MNLSSKDAIVQLLELSYWSILTFDIDARKKAWSSQSCILTYYVSNSLNDLNLKIGSFIRPNFTRISKPDFELILKIGRPDL